MKMRAQILSTLGVGALLAASSLSSAAIVAQWNFNSSPGDADTATGSLTPSIGTGSLAAIGGVTTLFGNGDANGGSSDTQVGDDTGLQTTSYAAPGAGSGTTGVRFSVSTVGQTDIIINYDLRHSNTSSRFEQLQYSLDGTNFITTGLANNGVFSGNAGDTWFNARSVDLSAITAADNNANFAFRVVAIFDPAGSDYAASNSANTYAGTGTWRFDMVTLNGTPVPEPTGLALLGLAALPMLRRKR